jgi:ubiquinone/menaquinone biosynthesis C-methylase UbiE
MIREVVHFVRTGVEVSRRQKESPRAEFVDWMVTRADAQGYAEVRRELVGDLTGRVLEIGCGTGAMFAYYGPEAQVEGIEPEQDFLALAVEKAKGHPGKVQVTSGDGMKLAFADATFDAVVLGLVLCSVPSVHRVLAEASRVLRAGGRLRALEHVRSERAISGFLMDVTDPLWLRLNRQGCHWNRDPRGEIVAAGFEVDDVRAFQRFDTVMPAFPMCRVRAHRP